jgi:hypothetical protein
VGGLNLTIQGGGEDIYIQYINITNCVNSNVYADPGLSISSGSKAVVNIVCAPVLTVGQQFRGSINIDYKVAGGARDLTSTGNIVRKVIA